LRSPGEIKSALLYLRHTAKLSMADIGRRSRCSAKHLADALKMEASETILRRIDAFLDAKQLHEPNKTSATLHRIERMTIEIRRLYGERTMPMRDVMRMPTTAQQALARKMNWRLKRLLRAKVIKDFGFEPFLPDSESYWRSKTKVLARVGELAPHRKPDRSAGPSPVPPNGQIHDR
jgi:AraC-like DNA-binding protein